MRAALLMTVAATGVALAALLAPGSSFAVGPDALGGLVGTWQGELAYRDYGSGDRISIPARVESRLSGDGNFLITEMAFTDPGRIVYSMDVSSLSAETGNLVSTSFSDDERYEETMDLTRKEDLEDGWVLVFSQQGSDDGRPAEFRITRTLSGNRFSSRKDSRYLDEEAAEWFMRNELIVDRVIPKPEDLIGSWKVDLRPTPDAEPYYQTFVVTSVEGNSFEGTFYGGSALSEGRINLAWGSLSFAFATEDDSGFYNTTGRIEGDRIEGTTHSLGRDMLWVWTATRVEEE